MGDMVHQRDHRAEEVRPTGSAEDRALRAMVKYGTFMAGDSLRVRCDSCDKWLCMRYDAQQVSSRPHLHPPPFSLPTPDLLSHPLLVQTLLYHHPRNLFALPSPFQKSKSGDVVPHDLALLGQCVSEVGAEGE